MKQPELGRKIAELRKTKRLTQEELVDRCNISIRTIQRIESGEVTPRDYTIKTILGALNYDLDEIDTGKSTWTGSNGLKTFFLIGADPPTRYLTKHLHIAWIFGVGYFVFRFIEGIAEYSRFADGEIMSDTAYVIIKLGIVLALIFFQRGFIIIGALFENPLLKMISSVLIVVAILVIGFDIISVFSGSIDLELVVLIYSVAFGATGIIFGYALIRLPKPMGRKPKLAGALEIIAACFSLTVILSFLGPFILIPAELLEIMIIYKATEIIRKNETANDQDSMN